MWVVLIKNCIFKVLYSFIREIILLAEEGLKLFLIVAILPSSGVPQQ